MGMEYSQADSTVIKLVDAELKRKHQKRLIDADVTILTLMARKAGGGHALYLYGYACAATIGIMPYRERASGLPDARLTIDAALWEYLPMKERVALLDHELSHLEVKIGKDKTPDLDAAGRPKLAMRMHDWELGGFADVCERHGEHALELQAIRGMQNRYKQLVFGFAEETDVHELVAAAALLGTARPKKAEDTAQQTLDVANAAAPDVSEA